MNIFKPKEVEKIISAKEARGISDRVNLEFKKQISELQDAIVPILMKQIKEAASAGCTEISLRLGDVTRDMILNEAAKNLNNLGYRFKDNVLTDGAILKEDLICW